MIKFIIILEYLYCEIQVQYVLFRNIFHIKKAKFREIINKSKEKLKML